MNICIANIRECNAMVGGVERVSSILARDWARMGIRVIFLSQFRMEPELDYDPIVSQYYLPDPNNAPSTVNIEYAAELCSKNGIDIVLNQSPNFSEFTSLLQHIKHRLPVCLVSSYHYAPLHGIAAQRNNFFIFPQIGLSPSRIMIQCLTFLRFHLFKRAQMYRQERLYFSDLLSHSDAVVVLCERYLNEVRRLAPLSNRNKMFAIPNPLALGDTRNIEVQIKKRQILYVGRLEYGLKRVDRLLGIWGQLHRAYDQWELVIVGDGDYRYSFEKMVRDYKIRGVRFEGFKEPEEYMSKAAILCMTSSAEGFGMVLVEAQRHGCVPIAYDSFGAVRDIIEDGQNGMLVKPFRQKEYIAKLIQLMDNHELRHTMAINGWRSVARFDSEKIATRWVDLFRGLLKTSR